MTSEPRTIFALRIAGRPGQAGVHQLRALLKELLRRHSFRALDLREEHDAAAGDVNTNSPSASAQRPADHFAPTIGD
jgi:hypothetical protein